LESVIYLDNAATTQVDPTVAEKIHQYLVNEYGNPSSLHPKGLAAEAAVRSAREDIAAALGVEPKNILFTSGGTEANNTAVFSVFHKYKARGGKVFCSSIEHPSVLAPLKAIEKEMDICYIRVDSSGQIDLNHLEESVSEDVRLFCLMAVNNEVGSIQPITEAVRIVKKANPEALILVDAVQAFGKIDVKPIAQEVDFLSISAHKIHGPKGIGVLCNNLKQKLKPLIYGGGQEQGLRSGTENVPGVIGLQEAVRISLNDPGSEKLYELKTLFYEGLKLTIPDVCLNGPPITRSAPHIINLSFPGVKGEVLVRLLGQKGICISTGSACSSRTGSSHVLKAMGLSESQIDSSVRISFSKFIREDLIEKAIYLLAESVNELRRWN
jgi:cysteine desulfurase